MQKDSLPHVGEWVEFFGGGQVVAVDAPEHHPASHHFVRVRGADDTESYVNVARLKLAEAPAVPADAVPSDDADTDASET